jgi:ADP-L-glycero-D-manno-heptose 6-epimerase
MIAITGAAGFIGSNLAHRLNEQGEDLLLVDHPLSRIKLANWALLPRFQFVEHSIFLERMDEWKPDRIFHLGACSSTTETNWNYLFANNIEYTQKLWNWCAKNGVPFVYASSAATYGNGSRGFDDQTHPQDLVPLNLYGKSKNDFDVWALAEAESGRPQPPKWAGLKFFNVYGPRESHKGRMASVVWQAYRQIRETGRMKLFKSSDPAYPDGGQTRDFVFVFDVIDHMLWHATSKGPSGIYNSGTGEPQTFRELVESTFDAMGLPVEIDYIPMPTDLIGKYQNFTQATMSKLRSAGYAWKSTSLRNGVGHTIRWLIENDL